MAARPYWSGQIQISLVSFGVKLYVATESKSEIRFHQISRSTGERVKYQKVNASDASDTAPEEVLDKSDIVKGYEFRKGEYIQVEPEEIARLRVPSKDTIELQQFVDLREIAPSFFEKPFFVLPDNDSQSEAFAVVRQALQSTNKAGLGKIAFGGREHLVALAPAPEKTLAGLMAYVLRYDEELRDAREYFSEIKTPKIQADQLALAKELIERKTARFEPKRWHDDYEAALRELVEAKVQNRPVAEEKQRSRPGKVVNLMDALRASVRGDEKKAVSLKKKPPARAGASESRRGLTVVNGGKNSRTARRKSA
jgi:DNA end-binding protein Ku